MAVRTSVIAAVTTLQMVDLTILEMAFPEEYTHPSQKVEFDVYEGGSEIALKGNFAKQSNIVSKDGFKTVTVNPMQVNESITDGVANTNKKRVGETVYGDTRGITAARQREVEEDAKGFGKLKKRSQRLIKKSAYDVLVTGKVTVSENGAVVDEIDYGMTNKIVNDNATAGQYHWNDTTNSDPIKQLETEALEMGEYAVDTYILGSEAHKAFIAHPKVLTSNDANNGIKQNFQIPTPEERSAKSTKTLVFVGTTLGVYGKSLEIYVELDKYSDGAAKVNYMDKNYAVGFEYGNTENAQIQYGSIPVATGEGEGAVVETIEAVEWIDAEVKKDPAGVKRYYRSSPLPTMNQPKAFISIKATLVA